MNRKKLVGALVAKGHTAEKALEIAIDYERGNEHAKQWLATLGIA